VLISNCGHWTQQERPDETNRVLLDFLKDVTANGKTGR
jgi:pimeloyl-ACP methyl ester carboxylesterase